MAVASQLHGVSSSLIYLTSGSVKVSQFVTGILQGHPHISDLLLTAAYLGVEMFYNPVHCTLVLEVQLVSVILGFSRSLISLSAQT